MAEALFPAVAKGWEVALKETSAKALMVSPDAALEPGIWDWQWGQWQNEDRYKFMGFSREMPCASVLAAGWAQLGGRENWAGFSQFWGKEGRVALTAGIASQPAPVCAPGQGEKERAQMVTAGIAAHGDQGGSRGDSRCPHPPSAN